MQPTEENQQTNVAVQPKQTKSMGGCLSMSLEPPRFSVFGQ